MENDYRIDYIRGKMAEGQLSIKTTEDKIFVHCAGGFEFEVVPVMARNLSYFNPETNETTTITKSSINVKQHRGPKPAEQLKMPGVITA